MSRNDIQHTGGRVSCKSAYEEEKSNFLAVLERESAFNNQDSCIYPADLVLQ